MTLPTVSTTEGNPMNEYTIEVTEIFKVRAESREAAVALLVSDPNAAGHPDVDWIDVRREVVAADEQEVILRVVQIDERTPMADKMELLDAAVRRGEAVRLTVQMDTFDAERELVGPLHRSSSDRWRCEGRRFRANHVKRMELI